ncbi:MAG: DUF438 domain-containing protein [Bacteroidales bacterium]|nr:DUF438 domain-containing protein [Bacteroidales bacterium]
MSEFIKKDEKRVEDLLAFSLGMMTGEDGRMLIEKYKEAIEHVTPHDMLKLEDKQMQMGIKTGAIKKDVDKVINIFFKRLKEYSWKKPNEGTFLYYLMLENKAYEFKLNSVKKIVKSYKGREVSEFLQLKKNLLGQYKEFEEFEAHYIKKENILFPFLEKKWSSYRPLNVMWSLHDDIRKKLKQIINILKSDSSSWAELNKEMGAYYFLVFGMIQKENFIVYPVASETVSDNEWEEMHKQSFEYPFPFIEKPVEPKKKNEPISEIQEGISQIDGDLKLKSETGELSFEQILLLLNNLPVDITFIDENDRVKFFSRPEERFFPRSPAIIGRTVQNCHPPESVHVVEKIIAAFKNSEKDNAKFWLQLKGKFILIQYFALRNDKNEYKGILEVSQDVTGIRALKGEQRLLDWD